MMNEQAILQALLDAGVKLASVYSPALGRMPGILIGEVEALIHGGQHRIALAKIRDAMTREEIAEENVALAVMAEAMAQAHYDTGEAVLQVCLAVVKIILAAMALL